MSGVKGLCARMAGLSVLFAAVLLQAAPEPRFHLALDGSTVWGGTDGDKVKPAVVHGASKYVDGVSGQGLDVRRHAYDQVTALVAERLPGFNTRRGTVAFWFRPHWNQNDSETHRILGGQAANWRPFRFYMVKGGNGTVDFSFVPSRQIQFLLRDVFRKDEWAHVAFTWNAADGSVRLYVNGRLVDRKGNTSAFAFPDERVDLMFQCGEGTDRFKANVGDGVYDDIRFYDEPLTESDIFVLSTGGTRVEMSPVSVPASGTFRFAYRDAQVAAARPLMRLATSGGARLTLSAMGASRKLSLVAELKGRTGKVECADTLLLDHGYELSLRTEGRAVRFLVDGAPEGEIRLGSEVGAIVRAEAAEGVTVGGPSPAPRVTADRAGEAALWTMGDAARRTNGVRRAVSLNGYWRTWPVDDYLGEPPDVAAGYMRVPGSFRSPLWNIHSLPKGRLDAGRSSWRGKELVSYRAAWYERIVEVNPRQAAGGRLWIVFDHLNADAARIWWNGEQVKAVRQALKGFTMVPNRVRIDVTGRLAADGRNVLRLYVDRHYVGLWRGVPSIGDHGEICLGDVWLERTPGTLHVAAAVAFPSWRRKSVTLRTRIANPDGIRGKAVLRHTFTRPGERPFRTASEIGLTGAAEQVVVCTNAWANPTVWSAETPETYAMDVSLERGGDVADTFPAQRFGFREVWVEKGGFAINGVPLRLRMWTSPGLERLRYYYGHPDAIDQYVARIRDLNYDTVRDNPWGKGSLVGIFEFLDSCDRLGVYNLHQMPTFEDEPAEEYAAAVERFVEAYGNHPSIIMWYTDFNTCGYAWDQDPAKLTDVTYDPPAKRDARRRVRTAEGTMRRFDVSRELFQHAGGNSGRIFTSMNYQSYGTPLQEQEDWPAQWAKAHVQPLMVVESAFPYPGQFDHFDRGGAAEQLGAEQAARYFGESAFAAERYPAPHSANWCWTVDGASGDDPNLLRLSALHYSRVVKAWRGYGLNALGDFPGGRDQTRVNQTFDSHCVVYRPAGGDPKSPGLKPEVTSGWSEVQRHILGDYSRPDYLDETVRACFAPLLVFAGGDPDDFTNKDHAFFAGERLRKSVVIVNDRLTPQTVDFAWACGSADGRRRVEVPAGGIAKAPIEFTAPDVADKTSAGLRIAWRCSDGTRGRDTVALQFFPKRKPPRLPGAEVALYDPLGRTAKVLSAAGVRFRRVEALDGLPPTERLVVGFGAFAAKPLEGGLPGSVARALVFEQPTNALRRFVMTAPSYRDAFALAKGAPELAGLDDADLANWRGASDTVPAFVVSEESSPHYPRSKWKCGNGGIVSGCVIRKPSRGNFRTLVQSGFNLQFASLLVEEREAGDVTWCQLDVTCRYGRDPAATRLVDNLLAALLAPARPRATGRVAALGSAADMEALAKLGAKPAPWNGRDADTVFVLPGADLSKLPFAWPRETVTDFRAALPADPLFAGVSGADVYFRKANRLPSPAFGVRTWKGVRFVFLGVGPDGSVKGLWNDEKLSRLWSAALGNAGVRLTPSSPYVDGLDLYDGDAFHNW